MKKNRIAVAALRVVAVLLAPALTGTWIEVGSAQDDLAEEGYYNTPILIQIAGEEEIVWFNAHNAGGGNECTWHDTPDQPTLGIRDHLGRINLFGGGFSDSFKMIGDNFSVDPEVPGHLTRVCHEIFTSGFKLPGAWVYENFRNHDWISGLIVDEEVGNFVSGLLQNEFWGAASPQWGSYCAEACPPTSAVFARCWINSVTTAYSIDGGGFFRRGDFRSLVRADALDVRSVEEYEIPQAKVVAKIIDTYVPCQGRAGYLAPTNIVRLRDPNTEGTRFVAMLEADGTTSKELSQQASGMCVIQCGFMYFNGSVVPDGRWRAWGGQGFDRDLSNGDVATVVGEPELEGLSIKNIFYLNDIEGFIGVGAQVDTQGTGNVAIFYSFSKDLINWSPRQKLIDSEAKKGMQGVTIYPSLINHEAHTHNLSNGSTSDSQIHVYMVRRMSNSSVSQVHRKVVRHPIRITVL